MIRAAALAVLTLSGTMVAADPMFNGDWAAGDPAQCVIGVDAGMTRFALRIEDSVVHGVESACRMTNPVQVRGLGAVLYDLDCTGEGDTWSLRALMMIDAEGQLVYIADGFAHVYPRCTGYADLPRQK